MKSSVASRGWFSSCRDRGFFSRRPSEESGFTIIELVVSMALLAIVAAPLASVFWASIRTAGSASHRTDGAAIASREIEGMHAVPYAQVGFYDDQTPGVPPGSPVGTTVVSLGATSPAPGNALSPQIQPVTPDPKAASNYAPDPDPANANPIVLGMVPFTVHRYIVWADAKDPSKSYSQAYKQLTVTVTWRDQSGQHTVREDSLLYPGGLGTYAGAGPVVTTTTAPIFLPAAPVLADITPLASPLDETQVSLNWTQPPGGGVVTSYTVEYSTDPSFPAGNFGTVSNAASPQPVPSLAPDTTYYFEVIANSAAGSVTSNSKSIHTAPLPAPVCTLGGLNVTGATNLSTTGTILKSNGRMSENLTLSWTTSGPCNDVYEVHGLDPVGSTDPGSPYALSGSGGAYSGTVASANQKNWGVGLHTFTVWDVNTGKATTVVKTFKVCVSTATSC